MLDSSFPNIKTVIAVIIKVNINEISIPFIYHLNVLSFLLSLLRININNNIMYTIPVANVITAFDIISSTE